MLTMSDVERGIYDSTSNREEKRQLCCHLQIAARVKQIAGIQQKSLDEVKDAMIAHTKLVSFAMRIFINYDVFYNMNFLWFSALLCESLVYS